MQVNIKHLVDDGQCYQTVRKLRWPDGVTCPSCPSTQVITRGLDDTEPARQRYECTDGHTRFADLTDTMFAGHHQPLKVWVLCLYFMGLHVSNDQIAHELDVNRSDVHQMTTAQRKLLRRCTGGEIHVGQIHPEHMRATNGFSGLRTR